MLPSLQLSRGMVSTKRRQPILSTVAVSVEFSARMSCACAYADNLKLTFPVAAATFQMAWGVASLPGKGNGVNQQVFTEVRWATDYLLACYSGSSLVIQARLSVLLCLRSPRDVRAALYWCQAFIHLLSRISITVRVRQQ